MLYEMRTYTTRPFKLRQQLELFERHGLRPIARNYGYPLLVGVQEDGNVNSYVHIYTFESFNERFERQTAMRADPEMQEYLARLREADTVVEQQCRFLLPPAFFDPAKSRTLSAARQGAESQGGGTAK